MSLTARRLTEGPIIFPHMDDRMGDNITGPSLIRMPAWVPDALGRYYLYFADHKGSYIRLAYADRLTGPWHLHRSGALDIVRSRFPATDPVPPPAKDRPAWAKKMAGGYLYAHIASPDVHLDHEGRIFRMYYHGLLWNGDQQTRLAISHDGLSFDPYEPLLGPPYFRAFRYDGCIYVITWGGEIWRAEAWEGPFEPGPQLFPYAVLEGIGRGFRHGEVFHRAGETCLHVFYTNMGDCPEAILYAAVDLKGDWKSWRAKPSQVLLEPELTWEGADLPLEKSVMGAVPGRVRQLRDPCVFEDADGRVYLLYCGAGEGGIGLAELSGL